MASEKEIEKRKAVLRARGVPERFIDAIARRKGSGMYAFIIITALVAMGLAYLNIIGRATLMSILAPQLYPAAKATLLTHTPDALARLVAAPTLFVLILPVLWLAKVYVRRTARPFPAYDPIASYLRDPQSPQPPDWTPEKLADLPDDAAFLTAMREPWPSKPASSMSVIVPAMAIMMLLAGFFAWRMWDGIGIYHTVTLEGVRAYGDKDAGTYPFTDAKYVFIQCVPGRRTSIHYVVAYPPKGFDIWTDYDPVHNLDADQVVARIGKIDNRLRSLNVMIKTLSRAGPNGPPTIACVDKWAKDAHVKNKAAVERLIFGD